MWPAISMRSVSSSWQGSAIPNPYAATRKSTARFSRGPNSGIFLSMGML